MQALIIFLAIVSYCAAADDIPCGKQAPGNEPIGGDGQYIAGGIHAKPHSWPWAGAFLQDSGEEPLEECGATILDKRWVLTAGHCGGVITRCHLKLGADDRGTSIDPNEPTQQILTIEKVFVNPNWDEDAIAFDLTLVKLNQDIQFNDNVRPICLPNASETLAAGDLATTIGWGLRENDGEPEYRQLQQIKLPVWDPKACGDIYTKYDPSAPPVLESCMVCAGYNDIHNTSGTYAGDSGSALMAFRDGVWKLYGVTSWRTRWEPAYLPGVWAYVPKMIDWVKETMHSN